MKTRPPVWKILAAVTAVLLLGIGLFFAWVQAVANRRWSALEKRVPELIAEVRARDPRRPVLRGEAVPGSAWVDYEQAMAALNGAPYHDLSDWLNDMPKADRAKAEVYVTTYGPALDFLQSGARREEGAFPIDFGKGSDAAMPLIMRCQRLVELAMGRSRLLREAGETRAAAGLLLDAAQMSVDTGRNSLMIGELCSIGLLSQVLEALKSWMEGGKSATEALEVERILGVLDGGWEDRGEGLLNDHICTAVLMTTPEGLNLSLAQISGPFAEEVPSGFWSGWRYGFSRRLQVADAVDIEGAFVSRAAAARQLPWSESLRFEKEARAEVERLKNPLARALLSTMPRGYGANEAKAKFRLLRAALRWFASREILSVSDPFGTTIRSASIPGGMRFWSLGRNGIDDGGAGRWVSKDDGDIVLEVKGK